MTELSVEIRRREILTAALALADERGLDALSMRAVAPRVGVTPMALYPYVGNKDALLDGLVDLLLAELLPAAGAPATGTPGCARSLTRAARSPTGIRRPTRCCCRGPRSPPTRCASSTRSTRRCWRAGAPAAQVPRLERLVSTFVLGYAVGEVTGRFRGRPAGRARRGRGQSRAGAPRTRGGCWHTRSTGPPSSPPAWTSRAGRRHQPRPHRPHRARPG